MKDVRAVTLLALLAVAGAMAAYPARLGRSLRDGLGTDLRTHYLLYADVLAHDGDLYEPADVQAALDRRGDLFPEGVFSPYSRAAYPPPFFLPFVPLSRLSLGTALAVWTAVCQLCLAGAVVLFLRLRPGGTVPVWVACTVVAAALGFGPVLYDVKSGQCNLPLLFFMTLSVFLAARGRWVWAGLPAALALLAKVPLVFVLPAVLAAGWWPLVLSAAVWGAAVVGLSLVWLPWKLMAGYLSWMGRISVDVGHTFAMSAGKVTPLVDLSLRGWFSRVFSPEAGPALLDAPGLGRVLAAILGLALLAFFTLRAVRARRAGAPALRVAVAGLALPFFASPHVMYYYQVWLLLPLWWLLRDAAEGRAPLAAPVAAWVLLVEPSLAWRAPLAQAFPAAAWPMLAPPMELGAALVLAWWLTKAPRPAGGGVLGHASESARRRIAEGGSVTSAAAGQEVLRQTVPDIPPPAGPVDAEVRP